jgi:hypothetical protein
VYDLGPTGISRVSPLSRRKFVVEVKESSN